MRTKMELAPTPVEEPCEQLGPNYRPEVARAECKAFIGQLKRQFGDPPPGASLIITSNPHDFGTYLEVAVRYDDWDEVAADYAFKLEGELPAHWDAISRAELDLVPQGWSHV
jgi:hypothetical protein